jgi:hypothetical protein
VRAGWLAAILGLSLLGWDTAAAAQPAQPVAQCNLADKRLAELSGLVADSDRWYAVNDSLTRSSVVVLSKDCKVERVISGPTDPYDVEDLARAPDGTFWLSDTGDNDSKRTTVALIALTIQGKSTLYRLTYPDGPHDTEALLLDKQGVPHLITKNPLGSAGVYRPAGKLASPGPTALQYVGSIRLTATGTPGGPLPGLVGSVVVTGAAALPDGSVVALRTYTDAYLFGVPDGDLVAALGRPPVRVPLPNEQQGEAIAFEPDGALVSASEGVGQPIRVVSGAADLVAPKPTPPPAELTPDAGAAADQPGGQDGLPPVPAFAFTAVVIGGVLMLISRRRRRRGR